MRFIKVAVAVLFAAVYGNAYAFHSGGVAECEGCHTMHGGVSDGNGGLTDAAGKYLLVGGSTASAACLSCHQHAGDTGPSSYHISTDTADQGAGLPPKQMTPGGDFGWLRKNYSWTGPSGSSTDIVSAPGNLNGHNINAPLQDYVVDPDKTTAPGGTYPAAKLDCSSCHDPHGKYRRNVAGEIKTTGLPIGNSGSYSNSAGPTANWAVGVYRILGGAGYQPKSTTADYAAFTFDPPTAVAPATYNRTEAATQTRVAYGAGMSEWCANCHSGMHVTSFTSGSTLKHPAGNGAKLAGIAALYNQYVKSGIMTGSSTTSYSSLVPFEEGTTDNLQATYDVLKTHASNADAYLNGPDATNANVSCMSCHRAHASGFNHMLRFQYGYEFTTFADATNTGGVYGDSTIYAQRRYAQGKTIAETTAAYYGRPATVFGPFARVLCNKCHAKD